MARARRGVVLHVGTCAAALLFATTRVALATDATEAERPRVRLRFDAPAECPDREAFLGAVRARTPRPRFEAGDDEEASNVLSITLDVKSSGAIGRLELRESDGTAEARHVESRSCREVVDALALIAAVLLDPDARTGATPPFATALTAPSAPEREPPLPLPRATPMTASDRRTPLGPPRAAIPSWHASAGVALGARGGIGPALAPDAGVFLDVERRGPVFEPALRLSFDVARTSSDLRGGSHTYEWFGWTLRLCPVHLPLAGRVLRVSPCGAFQIGGHRGTSRDVPGASSSTALWLAPIADAALEWEASSAVSLELRAGVLFPLRRTRFFLAPDSTIFEVPGAAGNAGLGARIRFM